MKKLITLFLLLIAALSFSQTQNQIREESFPSGSNTDNSDYAKLWGQIVQAKYAGNLTLYKELSDILKAQYPDKFTSESEKTNSPLHQGVCESRPPFNPNQPDWGAGDVRITNGTVATGSPGNPRQMYKNIRLCTDTTGVLFAGSLNGTKDTVSFYKSTNSGLNWTRITYYYLSVGKFHSFDMFVTDSTGGFRLGVACSVTPSLSSYAGNLYWISFKDDGTGGRSALIRANVDGKGFVGPAIVSDGFTYAPGLTYWYVTYQQLDTATGVTNVALLNMSTDWGYNWVVDSARNSYNDYDLDVDYNHFAAGGDTIYVNLTNNLTTTNENMRLRYVALSGIGTATAWKQYNTGASTDPEYSGSLAVNRITNEMGLTYTRSTGSDENIYYTYALTGTNPWVADVQLTSGSGNENNSSLKCSESQGAFRLAYHSTGASYDTIVYKSTFSLATGFSGHQVVNATNNSRNTTAPDVIGFKTGATSYAGGVLFAGATTALWFDASAITPTDIRRETETAKNFSLLQNYPNPFNPVTNIKFSIPSKEYVTLKVYDITGKEMAVLLSRNLNQGTYSVSFDGRNISSGVYFYKIEAGNFSDVKKMILVK